MLKLFTLYIYLETLLCGCSPDKRNSDFATLRSEYNIKIERIGKLDKRITESSGLAFASDTTFRTHADGGPLNELYEFNLRGELLHTIKLPLKNNDWEDLAQAENGQLFIGDFGNNFNTRQNLRIYKLQQNLTQVQDTIRFRYADQLAFPPARRNRHYDLEAFFSYADSLYLFTKSRAPKSITQLYTLPARQGNYTLTPKYSLRVKSPITAAAISPAQNQFALLGYGRLYLFDHQTENITLTGKRYCLPLGRTGQAEAILYLNPTTLLITNERGKLYLVTISPKN